MKELGFDGVGEGTLDIEEEGDGMRWPFWEASQAFLRIQSSFEFQVSNFIPSCSGSCKGELFVK